MKTSQVIALIIVIVAGILIFNWAKKNPGDTNTPTPPTPTASIVGCYVATLSKDVYTLQIATQKNGVVTGMLAFNNFEKDSSSGSFTGTYDGQILRGNYSFDSEGMHSDREVVFKKVGTDFVEGFGPTKMVDGKEVLDSANITYDPKSTFKKTDGCTLVFTDATNTVRLTHNAFFAAFSGDQTPTKDWKLNATQNGVLLATVSAPRTYMPKTNFSEARLTIGRSNNSTEIKNCTVKTAYDASAPTDATISGFPFKKFMMSDAGAGNRYDTTSYRGIFDGDCYVIEYTIHYTNIGNYDPSQGVTEFDQAKITSEMENVVKSVKFLISSN